MGLIDWIAEEKIKTAIEDGSFDNLPGKGQPLRLEDNPYEPEDWRLAFHLLRNNGFDLPWIETARQIEADLQEYRAGALRASRSGDNSAWERYAARFAEQIAGLNRRIFQYNLQVPSEHFQRPLVDLACELEAITAQDDRQSSS